MDPVTILDTTTLQMVLSKIESMNSHFEQVAAELKSSQGKWMTINQVVEYTGLSRTTVNLHRDKIGRSDSGNCIRFKRSDVDKFMEAGYYKRR